MRCFFAKAFILLPAFLLFSSLLPAQNKLPNEDKKEQKHLEKLKAKYADWNNCYIIMNSGDSVRCKIRDRSNVERITPDDISLSHGKIGDDYSSINGVIPMKQITFTTNNETEQKIDPSSFKELIIPDEDSEFCHYITLNIDTQYIDFRIFRVIVEGKCKLLFDQIQGSAGLGTVRLSRYYVYYNGKLTRLRVDQPFVTSAFFRKKSGQIFAACPALMEDIAAEKLKAVDLKRDSKTIQFMYFQISIPVRII